MVSKAATLRIARPTDNLQDVTDMYLKGLGLELLGEFKNHSGFNGSIIGHPNHNYHLEFTHHIGTHISTRIDKASTQDNLLVFYIADIDSWKTSCAQMIDTGFKAVDSYNPYWDAEGKTFEDIDGYRVVLQNREWNL